MENKFAKVPVASHGLHEHKYNYPWLSSINFGDVMPCYINTVRRGEHDHPRAGVFSQLMPIAHNAFATGRYNFKAIFVPYKLVWRPWYAFDQQTEFHSEGKIYTPKHYPYVTHNVFSTTLLHDYGDATGDADNYDVILYDGDGPTIKTYYLMSDAGRRILRILGALGCMPSFDVNDNDTINILPIMCYLKAFADYYFPNNYVGSSMYHTLSQFFERDENQFDNYITGLCSALEIASLNFYENSVFDLAWDNPVSPNVYSKSPSVVITDVSNNNDKPMLVTNDDNASGLVSPAASDVKPTNGTPFVGGTKSFTSTSNIPGGVLTKYVIDSLKALTLWTKRHQLSGAKVLERFLVSRGISLPQDSARVSYYLGSRNIEIQVSGVENNTDSNLGELAGRGVASSGDSPLSFDCKPDDDGIFLIIVSPLPDANFPVLLDGFSVRKDFLDNYTAEYDKLGATAVPSRIIQSSMDGQVNNAIAGVNYQGVFGFLNRYWDEVQERPRLLGDFLLQSRGAEELRAYHTFRLLNPAASRHHSYSFIRMNDSSQYQRLFYSDVQENLMLFLRWYGKQYKEKLPLGDSYDWDDDELNRKVSVVVGGSQK